MERMEQGMERLIACNIAADQLALVESVAVSEHTPPPTQRPACLPGQGPAQGLACLPAGRPGQ